MVIAGTVINGVIVPDGNEVLTEGTRVRIEVTDNDQSRELDLLRKRIAEMRAGVPGVPLREAMASIARELNLPPAQEG